MRNGTYDEHGQRREYVWHLSNDVCFFYSFGSDFSARLGVIDPENMTVDGYSVSLFHGIHHGFIVEEGDTISMVWTTLIPIN